MIKQSVGILAALITLLGFVFYLRDVFRGKTKPHAFTWLIWSSINAVVFAAQITESGGAGSLVSGSVCVGTFAVFVSSLAQGEQNVVSLDWIFLAGAGLAGICWILTDGPLLSVILVTIIDGCGFLPTFRKSYYRPNEESISLYILDNIAFLASVFALDKISVETALFPLFVITIDSSLVGMILLRRRIVDHTVDEPVS